MSESQFVGHEACPSCGSGDNLARYDDGHAYCFSEGCEYRESTGSSAGEQLPTGNKKPKAGLVDKWEVKPLTARQINSDTCQKFRYGIGRYGGESVQIANYFREGELVGQKVRFKNKDFVFLGDIKKSGLYGQWLWKPGNAKRVVVTEGEIDALTVAQLQDLKWPVVSIPNGTKGAPKAIQRELEWLEAFDQVVFMFDMDEPGQSAAKKCAELLSPGKAFIAELPLKDPNECLQEGQGGAVIQAIWNAHPFRPDGVVSLADIRDEAVKPVAWGLSWPWEPLTQATYGIRRKEIYGIGAGTGVGKTDVFTEIAAHLIQVHKLPVGLLFLEQPPAETVKRLAGKIANRRFHVPEDGWTEEELVAMIDELVKTNSVYLYNHFGGSEWDTIKAKIRFMVVSLGIKDIFLDHLTALAAHAEDERKELEGLMEEVASMAQELDCTIYFISHLATPDGRPHEEGGRVMIRHFKGSRAIGFWSHFLFGLERNQQAEDEEERRTTIFRCLKDRYTGQSVGMTFELKYDHSTGRLFLADSPEAGFNDEDCPF